MASKKRRIGYTARIEERCETPEAWRDDVLFTFDSGRYISFADATHHMMVLGTTGSGKTTSVILPCLDSLIRCGHFGPIIDIKGNLSAKIYAIAEKYGRTDDILELGTGDRACRLNILANLKRDGVRSFLSNLTLQNMPTTRNSDWHLKGVNWACDCAMLLTWLSAQDASLQPTLSLIAEMLDDYGLAHRLYKKFRETVFDSANKEHTRFVSTIENDNFHIFQDKNDKRGNPVHEIESQRTWNLQGIRMALKSFLEIPALRRNFCASGAPGLDMVAPLLNGKIILLRFDPDTGPIGARLARQVIVEFYAAVFGFGLRRPNPDKKVFVCIDEYQETADLSDGRYSDASFAALAREFGAMFIASSQSMSAIAAKGADMANVEAFVANCNQRILFYSDDPLTQAMASRYDLDLDLKSLKSGEAFAITYDAQNRGHMYGLEKCSRAYESTKDLIGINYMAGPADSSERQFSLCEAASLVEVPEHKHSEDVMESRENEIVGRYQQMFAQGAKIDLPVMWLDKVAWILEFFSKSGMSVKITALFLSGDGGIDVELQDNDKGAKAKSQILRSLLKPVAECCIICGKDREDLARADSEVDEDDYETIRLRRKLRLPFICDECQSKAARRSTE